MSSLARPTGAAAERRIESLLAVARGLCRALALAEQVVRLAWLRPRLVLDTSWLATLDRVPAELRPAVLASASQRRAWTEVLGAPDAAGGAAPGVDGQGGGRPLLADTALLRDVAGLEDSLLEAAGDLDDATDGVLVRATAAEALRLLAPSLDARARVVYLDPPYNTRGGSIAAYRNGFDHSAWCSMLDPVVRGARRLLAPGGVLAAAIDDAEVHRLGLLLERAFGEHGRLGTLVLEIKPSGRTRDGFLATSHEYCLFFADDPATVEIAFAPRSAAQSRLYRHADAISAYRWRDFLRTGGTSTPEERPNSHYPIWHDPGTGWTGLEPRPGAVAIHPTDRTGARRVWRRTRPTLVRDLARGDIRVVPRRTGGFRVLVRDRDGGGVRPKSVWTGPRLDAAVHGSKLLRAMFGRSRVFDYPKSLHAVRDVLALVAKADRRAVVVDLFAGSGTTGHAVLELDREDGGRRRFVLVEPGDAFRRVLVPRIAKALHAPSWRGGRPVATPASSPVPPPALSRLVQVLSLETFASALLRAESAFVAGPDAVPSLGARAFEDPLAFEVDDLRDGERRRVRADLPETFARLLGLAVRARERRGDALVVSCADRRGRGVLVLWRRAGADDLEALAGLAAAWLARAAMPGAVVYASGADAVEHLRGALPKNVELRPIQPDFERLMLEA